MTAAIDARLTGILCAVGASFAFSTIQTNIPRLAALKTFKLNF